MLPNKVLAGLSAQRDISLALRAGEIRALCGANGAGRSTLVNLLMGILAADAGVIAIDGVRPTIRGPQHAQLLGLGLTAQELGLAPRLSILDNIWLGSPDTGFGAVLPTGEGVFAFNSMEEAVDAIRRVESGYRRHSIAARRIAEEYFDSSRVLERLIETASRCSKLGVA
jgi:ABC-type sugar transport system ATPase subunit